jgi:3D (Asp-Asp-Asp) domain-containing protein
MTVVATAYTGDTITSTGTTPKWGTIAVDPTVIPYGTKVYIPQFDKVFIAEDCGGAIKGNKIDIFMNDSDSVNNW